MQFIKQELKDQIYFFGYSNVDEDSYSNFYHWDEHSADDLALHNGYKRVNAESMQEVLAQPRQVKQYMHNYNRDMVELMPAEVMARAQEPGLLYAQSCLEKTDETPAALGVKKQEI